MPQLIQFSPDSRQFAYSDFGPNRESLVILRSTASLEIVRTFTGHIGMVWRILFSPDDGLLAASDGQQTRLWQVEGGNLLRNWSAPCS